MIRAEKAWEKAASCAAQAKRTSDEKLKAAFERLRDSWIRIANDLELNAAQPPALQSRPAVTKRYRTR